MGVLSKAGAYRQTFVRILRHGRNHLHAVFWLATLLGGTWVFVELADEVTEGETRQLDENILLALRNPGDLSDPIGPGWVEEMGRDFTALGGTAVLTFITLATIGYLLL